MSLRARDAVTLEDELALCLQNASRFDPYSVSNKQLRKLLARPEILDYLERLVTADRRPTRSEQSLEGTGVNGLMPVGQEATSE